MFRDRFAEREIRQNYKIQHMGEGVCLFCRLQNIYAGVWIWPFFDRLGIFHLETMSRL